MKRLVIVNGTMGVGKTAVCRLLYRRLPRCAFLDGDWCWTMHPFTVNDETKAMALDHIGHLLTGFLRCTAMENVVFCWVLDRPEILEAVLARLPPCDAAIFGPLPYFAAPVGRGDRTLPAAGGYNLHDPSANPHTPPPRRSVRRRCAIPPPPCRWSSARPGRRRWRR